MEDDYKKVLAKVLIVDDDKLCLNLIERQIKELGASEVHVAENGDDATRIIESAQNHPFTLIIQDWKLHGLSGIGLFNRVRLLPFYERIPILVVSGFVDKNDFRILEEFPCTHLLEKPFTAKSLKDKLEKLTEESIWYQQNQDLLNEVMDAIQHDPRKLETIIRSVLKKSPYPTPLVMMAVRGLISSKAYKTAQSILELLFSKMPKSPIVATELGKTLMRRGQYKKALDVLSNADRLSAGNIQRICLMGEAQLNLKDFSEAQKSFSKALGIDPLNMTAKSGHIVASNIKSHPGAVPQISETFASLLNTVGIAMIREGKYDKGVEQYQSALPFIQEPSDHAKVAFNLGLGYLKWGKRTNALEWFQKSKEVGLTRFGKANAYVRNLVQISSKSQESPDEESIFNSADSSAKLPEITKPTGEDETKIEVELELKEAPQQKAPQPKAPQPKDAKGGQKNQEFELESLAQKLIDSKAV